MTNKFRMGNFVCTPWRILALLVFLTTLSGWSTVAGSEEIDRSALPPPAKMKIDFWRDVEPILRERCQSCHGPDKQMADLRLDNRSDAIKGGKSGPSIRPGNSAESKLIQSIAGVGKVLVMPFNGERLTAEQVGVLRAWIDQGAQWPAEPTHRAAHPKRDN